MTRPKTSPRETSGSALISTLLMIVVLTIIVTAFMQSMAVERRTANSYKNKLQAELAAEAGAAEGASLVASAVAKNYFHGVGVKQLDGQLMAVVVGAPNSQSSTVEESYLSSGNLTSSTKFTATNSVDVNLKKTSADQVGWIGSPLVGGAFQDREARALWVDILQDPSLPNQPQPTAANYNPIVARYAFWVDDETAKVDYSVVGNDDGASGQFLRSSNGTAVTDVDLGALPLLNNNPLNYAENAAAAKNSQIIAFNETEVGQLVDLRGLGRATDNSDVADATKFYATRFSLSNELAMTGRRRVNLNHIISNSLNPDVVAADLDDIGFVITGRHIMKAANPGLVGAGSLGVFVSEPEETGPLPNIGDRFYSGSATGITPDNKRNIYLTKLAANIRDYIDTDSQPTLVNATGVVAPVARPTIAPSISQAKPQAIGKEAIPYFQEHAWRGFIEPGSWSQAGNTVTANLRIDHYFEIFNPSTKDYVAPQGTFMKVYALPPWTAGSLPLLQPPDFEIDLSGITIPAGQVRVITTNTTGQHPPSMVSPVATLLPLPTIPADATRFPGVRSDEQISTVRGFQLDGRSSTTGVTDYRTEWLIGTNEGLLDYFPGVSISLSTFQWNFTNRGGNVGSQTRFVYSSSLRGNDSVSRTGDPRSLSEPLVWKDYQSGGNGDQSRFYGNIQGHSDTGTSAIPGSTATFGRARTSFVNTANWPDYHINLADTAATAVSVVRDNRMQSIGELGHIYDPHRKITTEATPEILHARGGGRTLKVGQRDDLVPAARFGTSGATTQWFNAAWRLCDLFSADDPTKKVSASNAPGKININGALRDNGVAVRAALREFIFLPSPDGDPARAGRKMSDQEITNLVDDLIEYLQTNGPMLERGELSQLPFFSGAGAANAAGGQEGSVSIDRSREEIFRRVVELITTRSLGFSIYSVGEAIFQKPNGDLVVKARSAKRSVIQISPEYRGGSGGVTFTSIDEPGTPPLQKPTIFRSRIIHESSFL